MAEKQDRMLLNMADDPESAQAVLARLPADRALPTTQPSTRSTLSELQQVATRLLTPIDNAQADQGR